MFGQDQEYSNQQQIYEQQQKRKAEMRYQANQIISKINCHTQKGKQIIAKSYRKINQIINKIQKDKFNFNQQIDLVDDVLSSAFYYKPYNMNDQLMKYRTSANAQIGRGSRKLRPPAIYIEHQLVKPDQKNVRVNSNKTQVTLKIQSQPNSNILYTNIPGSHPFLIDFINHPLLKPPNDQKYFYLNNSSETINIINPPCQLNIIAQSQFKLQSKLVSLKVSSQVTGVDAGQNYQFAIRPMESFPFEESAYSSQQPSSSNIEDYQSQQREHE